MQLLHKANLTIIFLGLLIEALDKLTLSYQNVITFSLITSSLKIIFLPIIFLSRTFSLKGKLYSVSHKPCINKNLINFNRVILSSNFNEKFS